MKTKAKIEAFLHNDFEYGHRLVLLYSGFAFPNTERKPSRSGLPNSTNYKKDAGKGEEYEGDKSFERASGDEIRTQLKRTQRKCKDQGGDLQKLRMELDQITKEKEELKTLLSHMKVIRSESATLKQEYINNEESRRQLQENYYKAIDEFNKEREQFEETFQTKANDYEKLSEKLQKTSGKLAQMNITLKKKENQLKKYQDKLKIFEDIKQERDSLLRITMSPTNATAGIKYAHPLPNQTKDTPL